MTADANLGGHAAVGYQVVHEVGVVRFKDTGQAEKAAVEWLRGVYRRSRLTA